MGKRFSKQRHKPRFTKVQIPWLIRGVIRSNNLETMQYLLSYPNDVNPSMVIDGVSPLNLAIELGHLQMAKLLIKAGADIHTPDSARNPLHQAALYGRDAIVELLICSGADVSKLNERHQSCLHLLAYQTGKRFLETACVLLANGCDPNNLDCDGLAPLHRATVEIVELMASYPHTNMNILSHTGDTPLLVAAKDRRESVLLALARVEVEHRQSNAASITVSNPANRTPSAKSSGSISSRLTLVSNGSTPNRRSGWATRVFRTSSAATIQLNRVTLCSGSQAASVGFRSTSNCAASVSALTFTQPQQQSMSAHNASFRCLGNSSNDYRNNSLEVMPKSPFIPSRSMKQSSSRVNLDQPDNVGMTALMICAEAGQSGFRMVIGLVSAGCDITVVDKMGMTALHYACYVGAIATVRFLIEESGEFSDKRPCDILNLQDRFGRTPIYLATCRGHTEVVAYLLSCNADIHIPNKELKSPLYIAANFGHLDIVNALLRNGAHVNQADSHQKTPIYVATYHGRNDIVSLLLEASANVNAADKNGKTPLYAAVLHGHLNLAAKLLSHGASVNRPDNEGLGPLHMAVKFPKLDLPMIKLLLHHGCDPVNLASFTRWLMGNGIIPEEYIQGDWELAEWLRREESNVHSLKRLCRSEIQAVLGRGALGGSGGGGGFEALAAAKIRRLPLPEHLRAFVSMKAL